jgi:type I restriction enzyme R subunit
VQHILASLNNTGRAAIVLDTGAASRGSGNANKNKEKSVRQWFVEHDVIEGVIYLPENLFYNTSAPGTDFIAINEETIDLIQQKHGGDDTKVINLIKSIEKTAEAESGDPFLIAMADRARAIQESYEDRQSSTQEALDELFAEIQHNVDRKRRQAEKGYDSLRYFVYTTIQEAGVAGAEGVSAKIANAFVDHPNWRQSEAALREVRKAVTFAVYAEKDDLDEVAAIVEKLLDKLLRSTA